MPVPMKSLNPTDLPAGTTFAPSAHTEGRLVRYMNPERVDCGYRIFPSERTVFFNEMEYAVPAASGPDCVREIRRLMQEPHPAVLWPIEYRTLCADDIPLSPAYARARQSRFRCTRRRNSPTRTSSPMPKQSSP